MNLPLRSPCKIGSLVLLALACDEPLLGNFPRSLADGLVHGWVTTKGGQPVVSARMGLHPPTADSGRYVIDHAASLTNSAGEYELDVVMLEEEFSDGIPDIVQLYLIAETSGDSPVIDSVLVPVAFAQPGETLRRTQANVRLPIP